MEHTSRAENHAAGMRQGVVAGAALAGRRGRRCDILPQIADEADSIQYHRLHPHSPHKRDYAMLLSFLRVILRSRPTVVERHVGVRRAFAVTGAAAVALLIGANASCVARDEEPSSCERVCGPFTAAEDDWSDEYCDGFDEPFGSVEAKCVNACNYEISTLSDSDRREVEVCLECVASLIELANDYEDISEAIEDCEHVCEDDDVTEFMAEFFEEWYDRIDYEQDCDGTWPKGFDNVEACEGYNSRLESVYTQCGITWDEAYEVDCSIYADVSCDVSDYFECLGNAYSCNPDTNTVELGDTAACADLADC